jgi:hypothetical protein
MVGWLVGEVVGLFSERYPKHKLQPSLPDIESLMMKKIYPISFIEILAIFWQEDTGKFKPNFIYYGLDSKKPRKHNIHGV